MRISRGKLITWHRKKLSGHFSEKKSGSASKVDCLATTSTTDSADKSVHKALLPNNKKDESDNRLENDEYLCILCGICFIREILVVLWCNHNW